MKYPSTKVCLITLLLFMMNQGILAEQINEIDPPEMNFLKGKVETDNESTEKKSDVLSLEIKETEEDPHARKLHTENDNQNNDYTFQLDQDLTFLKEIFLELSSWMLSKLDDKLKKKVLSKLEEKNIGIDLSLWQDFSDDEILKVKNAVLDTLSPYAIFLGPIIEKINEIIPKNIFNLQDFFNFPEKDEL